MARIVVTGSTDGLGRATAEELLRGGHDVIVHARTSERLRALDALVGAGATAVVGDLADESETRALAERVNELGAPDAVIHNAGVMDERALAVNVLAPHLLTALVQRPTTTQRLVYLSSDMHVGGSPDVRLDGRVSYAQSKFLVTVLAAAVARVLPGVVSHAVDPGWVPTRMGGPAASDDLDEGHRTQVWLATSADPAALETGGYWYHRRRTAPDPRVGDPALQDRLLDALRARTGVDLR